jgi:tRNA pseudouridine55 synthase
VPPRPHRGEEAGPASRGGVLVIDKPAGPTSHDIVALVRRRFRGTRVGHTGTLDPFATGVLPLVVGRATRLARYLSGADKEYDALIRLGRATDTHDSTGTVTFEAPDGFPVPAVARLAELLEGYRGTWMQTPPAYSAKRAGGVRAYDQARRGEPVALTPVKVSVSAIELLSADGPLVRVRLVSSAGFYVRALAHDIGLKLGTGAALDGLRRLRSGPFTLSDAVTLDAVVQAETEPRLLPLESLLPEWPAVVLTPEGTAWASHGRHLGPAQWRGGPNGLAAGTRVRCFGPDGLLIAVGEAGPGGVLHPAVVLV